MQEVARDLLIGARELQRKRQELVVGIFGRRVRIQRPEAGQNVFGVRVNLIEISQVLGEVLVDHEIALDVLHNLLRPGQLLLDQRTGHEGGVHGGALLRTLPV